MNDTTERDELMGALAEATGEQIDDEQDRLASIDERMANLNTRCDNLHHAIEVVASMKPKGRPEASGRRLRNLGAMTGLCTFACGCWWLSPQWSMVIVGGVVFVAALSGMILSQRKPSDV